MIFTQHQLWLQIAALLLTAGVLLVNPSYDVVASDTSASIETSANDMTDHTFEASKDASCVIGISSSQDQNHQRSLQPQPDPGVWLGQHIRNPLARAVFFKLKEDEANKNDRHVYWYRVITSRFPDDLQAKFVQFEQDEEADKFLENCQDKSDSIFTQMFYSLAIPVLNIFMTQTSINGLLNRGSMFIFSKSQFEQLLGLTPDHKGEALLDLGAGDGKVTKQMSSYFHTTYATEISSVMVRRLAGEGFKVLGVSDWQNKGIKYDLISCLNLLDRCDKPLTLLADILATLKPVTGRLLVAVVIPFKPYVEFESKTHQPTEFIHVKGTNFEEQVQEFVSIFRNSGFQVEKFTRLPYLCEGDLQHSFYVLTDAVFVLKATEHFS